MTDQQAPKYIPVAVVNYGVPAWQVERTSDSKVLAKTTDHTPHEFASVGKAQQFIDFLHAYGPGGLFLARNELVRLDEQPPHVDGPL
jgi:hypothetical protein